MQLINLRINFLLVLFLQPVAAEDADVPQPFKNLEILYWFRYGHAQANDNFSGIAIIANKIFMTLSHKVMIEDRLTHTKLQRLHNSEIYNIFCYMFFFYEHNVYKHTEAQISKKLSIF